GKVRALEPILDGSIRGPLHREFARTRKVVFDGSAGHVLSHYDVLGVEPTADMDAIRRAWRVKVRLLHPDKHRGAPDDVVAEAERETLRVNRVWETLADPARRRQYDAQL